MKTPSHAFREYDIRGKAASDLSDDLADAVGQAIATLLQSGREASDPALVVAVARDCRQSSDRLFAALTAGLRKSGANVIDIGVGPSPLLYFAAHHLETDGAIMITGSHNPAEDNGFKMMIGRSSLFGADIQKLREIIESETFQEAAEGSLQAKDISAAYIEAVAAGVSLGDMSAIKVVVDAGNGAAGPLALRTFERLGIKVEPLFCEMDGTFPNHHPDPTLEVNLEHLKAAVAKHQADFGIAYDGDGDRIGVVDDQGGVVWGDKLMILFSRSVLADYPGAAILGEVKCSSTLFDDIRTNGGRAVICKTGHSLIKKRMKDEGAKLAGEMSGHIFFADRYFGFDDAIYASARLIELVAAAKKSLRELLDNVPVTSITPEIRLDCPDRLKFAVVEGVLEHFRAILPVLDVDGARIDFGEGAWGLCRASNTGPTLVLRFEALSSERRDVIRAEVEAVVSTVRAALN